MKRKYITVYFVDPVVKKLVKEAAEREDISVSAFISEACRTAAVKELKLKQKTCGSCKGTGRVAA